MGTFLRDKYFCTFWVFFYLSIDSKAGSLNLYNSTAFTMYAVVLQKCAEKSVLFSAFSST